MTAEQLLLSDLVYEVNLALADGRDASFDERLGLRRIAKLIEMKLEAFDIDQCSFTQPLVDIDKWFAGD